MKQMMLAKMFTNFSIFLYLLFNMYLVVSMLRIFLSGIFYCKDNNYKRNKSFFNFLYMLFGHICVR